MILQYFIKKENIEKKIAKNLYKTILLKSRALLNENNFFINKNYNTGFEVISILLILYIKINILSKANNYKIINEELISFFISDLDESLRIKGIGDMSIGKYVKKYVKKFYYRLSKFPNLEEIEDFESFGEYLKLFDLIKSNEIVAASKIFYKSWLDIAEINNIKKNI